MTIDGGYIIIARKIIDSEIFDKPPLYSKVWLYLLSRAQHKDYKQLKRGQLWTSIPEIQKACSWKVGYRTEKPTKDQVWNVLEWLRTNHNEGVYEGDDESNDKPTMITTTRATHGLLINISNYNFYQTPSNYESNGVGNNEKVVNKSREQQSADNINKNVKNDKNEQECKLNNINQSSSKEADKVSLKNRFESIWELYPKKQGKTKACESYKKAVKDGVLDEQIIKGINDYNKQIELQQTDIQYIKQGQTFFNQRNYLDEFVTVRQNNTKQPSAKEIPKEWQEHYNQARNIDMSEDIESFMNELPY